MRSGAIRSGTVPASRPIAPLAALLHFHLRVGARVALAAMMPAFAAAAGALFFLQFEEVVGLAGVLFGRRSGILAAVAVFGVLLAPAAFAVPRVAAGMSGWQRHLPASGLAQRRAVTAALVVAQLPVVLLLAALAYLPYMARPADPAAAAMRWAGLVLVVGAVAMAALAGSGPAARFLALAAGIAAGLPGWTALATAAALLVTAGAVASATQRSRSRALASIRRDPAAPTAWSRHLAAALPLPARLAWRALGARKVLAILAVGLPPLAAAALFLRNNPPPVVTAGGQLTAAVLGGALACGLTLARAAGGLADRRPAWPWARTLPWSSRRRVLTDAAWLGAFGLPAVAAAACLRPAAALPLAAMLPYLAVRAAAALRRPPERRLGAEAVLLIEGLLVAGGIALVPWLALILAALAPWAARQGAAAERRLKVSRWMERHYLAVGDPAAWSSDG